MSLSGRWMLRTPKSSAASNHTARPGGHEGRKDIGPMERNKYELQRRVLSHKYADILQDFEEASDDRRVAWNCYQQILAACEAMQGSGMENNFICCAVNKSIRKQEAEIDEIITRFTGKVYMGARWVDVREEMKGEKFTYGYVDCVIGMMTSKEAARKLLREQLYDMRNELTREHYFDMYEYINAMTD